MKKFLLSIAALALGASMASATDYVVFDYSASDKAAWDENSEVSGYSTTVSVDGKEFTLISAQGSASTAPRNPGTESYSWRVYKAASFSIESSDVTMKQVVIYYDNTADSSNADKYALELTLSDGWSGSLASQVYTLVNEEGSNTFEASSPNGQVRINKIVVSDEAGEIVAPSVVEVNSVAETLSQASNTTVTVNYPLTVAFVSNKNVFAVDAAGDFIQVYGTNSYAANDIIPAGWEATYTLYSGNTPELVPSSTLPEATEQGSFEPKEVAASDLTTDLVNNVVLVKGVTFTEATPSAKENFTGTCDGVELTLRNNYALESVEAGTYDVTLLVTVYKDAPSLYVISYGDSSAVNEISAESNGVASYYNMQGVKVANPESGLYICVKDGKATKVLVRK